MNVTTYKPNIRHLRLWSSGHVLVTLLPHPEQQGLLGRDPEAAVQRRASGRKRAAAGRAARQGGARVQTGQRLHGGLTGVEGEAAGQLLDLRHQPTHTVNMLGISMWKESFIKQDKKRRLV